MGRAYEKRMARLKAAQDAAGTAPARSEPRIRGEVESFVKGFGLSAAATRRLVDEWMADQKLARDAGWNDAYESYM